MVKRALIGIGIYLAAVLALVLILGTAAGLGHFMAILSPEAQAENRVLRPKRQTYHPSRGTAGSTGKGHGRVAATVGAGWECLSLGTTAGSPPDLIPWNSLVAMYCGAAGWLCFSMTANGTDVSIAADGTIADANGSDGAGACFYCAGYYSEVLSRSVFTPIPAIPPFAGEPAVLARTGYCTAGTAEVGSPCRAGQGAECGTGGVCSASTGPRGPSVTSSDITGAYLCGGPGVLTGAMID